MTSRTRLRPDRDEFMDPDMKSLWHRMGPLPGNLRLDRGYSPCVASALNGAYTPH